MALRKFLYAEDTGGFPTEQAAADELSLGKVTLSGVGGVALDLGGQRAANAGTPTTGTDLATKSYVDAVASGITDFKDSARVLTTANVTLSGGAPQVVDGVTLQVGDRVLVTGQTAPAENGLYSVTVPGTGSNGTWVRSTDADTDAEVTAGMFIFVEEGSLYAETGWILATNNPITVGTTGLVFVQFTSVRDLVDGAGLVKTGAQLDIELATDPALEFDAGGVSGRLRWRPDGNRGLARDSSGAYVKLPTVDPALAFVAGDLDVKIKAAGSLDSDASGLHVLVDPTPNNLTSAAAGLSVKHAPRAVSRHTASANISAARAVRASGANTIATAAATGGDTLAHVIGVVENAINSAAVGEVVTHGTALGVLTGATANAAYYLGDAGEIQATIPAGAARRVIRIGFALNSTDLFVAPMDFGKKA